MTRILVIDNFDSFVYTLNGYLLELGATTHVVRNDTLSPDQLETVLSGYDGLLVSPGPGAPADAGISPQAILAAHRLGLPVLGVCLGHQAIGEVFGATVSHAEQIMHGKTSQLTHDGSDLFAHVPQPFRVTRYHSLAIVEDTVPDDLVVTARTLEGTIMAVQHRTSPIYGVQYHPESVLTEHGYQMIGNWLAVTGLPQAALDARGRTPMIVEQEDPRPR